MLTALRRRSTLPVVSFVAAILGVAPTRAWASSCTSPDLIETIPADHATGVPTNATLFARYETIAQYQGETVSLEQVGVDTKPGPAVPAMFDDTSGILQITPPQPLNPGSSYIVHWPALKGLDTATLGSKTDQHFTAGSEQYAARPTFAGVTTVTWDASRNNDSCTSSIQERYVYTLALGAAADDSGRSDSLTLLVFQTSGPGVDANAPTQVLAQRMPPAGQQVQVTSNVAVGHVCFSAIVRDLTLNPSLTSGPPVCVDTVASPFFYGLSCGISSPRRARGEDAAALALVALVLAVRAKRRAGCGEPAGAGQRRGGL